MRAEAHAWRSECAGALRARWAPRDFRDAIATPRLDAHYHATTTRHQQALFRIAA